MPDEPPRSQPADRFCVRRASTNWLKSPPAGLPSRDAGSLPGVSAVGSPLQLAPTLPRPYLLAPMINFSADRRAAALAILQTHRSRAAYAPFTDAELTHRALTESIKVMVAQTAVRELLGAFDHLLTGADPAVGESREADIGRARRLLRPKTVLLRQPVAALRVMPVRKRGWYRLTAGQLGLLLGGRALWLEVVEAMARTPYREDPAGAQERGEGRGRSPGARPRSWACWRVLMGRWCGG